MPNKSNRERPLIIISPPATIAKKSILISTNLDIDANLLFCYVAYGSSFFFFSYSSLSIYLFFSF